MRLLEVTVLRTEDVQNITTIDLDVCLLEVRTAIDVVDDDSGVVDGVANHTDIDVHLVGIDTTLASRTIEAFHLAAQDVGSRASD